MSNNGDTEMRHHVVIGSTRDGMGCERTFRTMAERFVTSLRGRGIPDIVVTTDAEQVRVVCGDDRAAVLLENQRWFEAIDVSNDGAICIIERQADGALRATTPAQWYARLHRKWNSGAVRQQPAMPYYRNFEKRPGHHR